MDQKQILVPMLALVGLTFIVLLLIPARRLTAILTGQATMDDFAAGESPKVAVPVSLANRNYMNLLEMPLLFYVLGLALYATGRVDGTAMALAWTYVALRAVHSLIHVTYNRVFHRFLVFAISNVVLFASWLRFGSGLV